MHQHQFFNEIKSKLVHKNNKKASENAGFFDWFIFELIMRMLQ